MIADGERQIHGLREEEEDPMMASMRRRMRRGFGRGGDDDEGPEGDDGRGGGRGGGGQEQKGQDGEEKPDPGPESLEYRGVKYNRKFDAYSKAPHPVETERWATQILAAAIETAYPAQKPCPYNLLLPEKPLPADAVVLRVMGCWDHNKDDSTWKEFEVLKSRGVVHVYNLVSHARRMYRQLVYSSNGRFALASLDRKLKNRPVVPSLLADQAGDLKRKRVAEPSLLVIPEWRSLSLRLLDL